MASLSLAFDILARDRASDTLNKVGDSADQAGGKLAGLGKVAGVAFAAVGAAAVAGAAKSITAFVDFQGSMNEVFTLLPGISEQAMGEMSGQVKNFSKEFGVLPDEVVPALYQSLSAGVPKDNVFEFLETAQMAAKGGVTELETAVNGITGVVNAYGSDVIDATKASDLMFTTVKLGKTTFDELSASLGDVTPLAGSLGVSFEEVSAAMAASTAITGNTAKSTTGLKSLLAELGKEGQIAAKNFEQIAGKSFPEFIKGGGNLAEALQLMKDSADASGSSVMDMFGGIEAGSAALQLAGSDVFAGNLDAMADSAGATKKAFETMNRGLGPIFAKFKAYMQVFLIDVGERLAPIVERALATVGRAFTDLRPRIETFVAKAREIGEWVRENKPVLIGLATAIGVGLTAAFVSWAAAAAAAAVATIAAAAPFIAIGAAIAGVTAGLVWAYQNVDIFRRSVDTVARFLTGTVWPIIQTGARLFTGTLVPAIMSVIEWYWNFYSAVFDVVGGVLTKVGEIVTFFTELPGTLARVAGDVWGFLRTSFVSVINFIIDAWNGLDFKLPSFEGLEVAGRTLIPGWEGPTLGMPTIPRIGTGSSAANGQSILRQLAIGTRGFAGGVAMVGELGPELVSLPRGSDVFSSRETRDMLGGSTYNVSIVAPAGSVRSERDLIRELRSAQHLLGPR